MSQDASTPERPNPLGKASLILGILSVILTFFVGSCVNLIKSQGGNVQAVRPMVELFGGTFALIGLLAAVLGVGGLFGKKRPRASAIAGLLLAVVALLIAAAIGKSFS